MTQPIKVECKTIMSLPRNTDCTRIQRAATCIVDGTIISWQTPYRIARVTDLGNAKLSKRRRLPVKDCRVTGPKKIDLELFDGTIWSIKFPKKDIPAKHLHDWIKFHSEYDLKKIKYYEPMIDYKKSRDVTLKMYKQGLGK